MLLPSLTRGPIPICALVNAHLPFGHKTRLPYLSVGLTNHHSSCYCSMIPLSRAIIILPILCVCLLLMYVSEGKVLVTSAYMGDIYSPLLSNLYACVTFYLDLEDRQLINLSLLPPILVFLFVWFYERRCNVRLLYMPIMVIRWLFKRPGVRFRVGDPVESTVLV